MRQRRAADDAARTLDTFADRLRDEVDLDALRRELLGGANRSKSPAHAGLSLRKQWDEADHDALRSELLASVGQAMQSQHARPRLRERAR